jgi:NAD(P)-dependent dehydrogenase (short-subunit alcohol dehydrogenase family)
MTQLYNRTILVTGASSGIGRETAIRCGALGAKVVLNGRNKNALEETAQHIPNSCILLADLSIESEIEKLVNELPELDGLVHCAGMIQPFLIKYIKQKHIDSLLKINLFSGILLSSNLLRSKKLNTGASLVFMSSVSAHHPYTGGGLYAVSKAGMESFAKAFALENADKKMRANVLSPALVKTAMFDASAQVYDKDELDKLVANYPLGIGDPLDIANMVVFLLSDEAKWITGTVIQMDGGLLLNSKR